VGARAHGPRHHLRPCTAIKSQVLTDFMQNGLRSRPPPPPSRWSTRPCTLTAPSPLEGAGVGVLLISPSGDKLRYALQLHFWATNNVAEYDALLHGIRVAIERGARCLFGVGAAGSSHQRPRSDANESCQLREHLRNNSGHDAAQPVLDSPAQRRVHGPSDP
jgi:hypothetical protein